MMTNHVTRWLGTMQNKCLIGVNRDVNFKHKDIHKKHTLIPVQLLISLCQFSIVDRGAMTKKGPGIP